MLYQKTRVSLTALRLFFTSYTIYKFVLGTLSKSNNYDNIFPSKSSNIIGG